MPKRFVLITSGVTLLACQSTRSDGIADADSARSAQPPAAAEVTDAAGTIRMRDADGRDVGTLTLRESGGALVIAGSLTSLPPGVHGMHLHTVGQCDAPAFTSAGGHWNPTDRQHGSQNPQGAHLGDLPNITVNADGSVLVNQTIPGGTMRGANGLLDGDGAAVVLHAEADDYRTDPAGNAGARLACGVIGTGGQS